MWQTEQFWALKDAVYSNTGNFVVLKYVLNEWNNVHINLI